MVSMFTTGKWHQMFHLCLMTQPVLPTPTSPIKMWCRTTILASLVLCSFVNLVSVAFLIRCISLLFVHDLILIPLFYSTALQTVLINLEDRLTMTRSMYFSLGFLMRKKVHTAQMVITQTTTSNIPSTDTQKDHCPVSVFSQLDLVAETVFACWQKHKKKSSLIVPWKSIYAS